jgi:AhpC/TSA family
MLEIRPRQTRRCLVVLFVAVLVGCGPPPATPPPGHGLSQSISPGSLGGLLDENGQHFELWPDSDVSTITAIVFTRSDCPISNRYAPTVKKLYQEYQPRGVKFYLVYVDPREGPEQIRQHLEEFDYPCPGLHDPAHELVAATGVTVTPEAVVFDAHRKIVYRGRIDDLYADFGQSRDEATTHDLADAIEAALSGAPVPNPVTEAVGCSISDLK